jgi:hypothetical protein
MTNDSLDLNSLVADMREQVIAGLDRRLYCIEQRIIAVNDNLRHWFDSLDPYVDTNSTLTDRQ